MFNNYRNTPGVYRQLSFEPKYYAGDDKIVINVANKSDITQEEIFKAAVYKIATGANKVVVYSEGLDIEKEIPTDEICATIEKYYRKPNQCQTIYIHERLFVITTQLQNDVQIVDLAGSNYLNLVGLEHMSPVFIGGMLDDPKGITCVKSFLEYLESYFR